MQEDNNEILQEKDSIDVMNKSIEENKPKKKNKKKKVIIAIIIILLLAYYFFIYKDNNTKEINTENKIMKTEYTMKGNDLQKFDLAFLKLENEKVNKIYSPLSIKYALEMLSTGANGESKSQIDSKKLIFFQLIHPEKEQIYSDSNRRLKIFPFTFPIQIKISNNQFITRHICFNILQLNFSIF